jgi:site-specific recombinase XerD
VTQEDPNERQVLLDLLADDLRRRTFAPGTIILLVRTARYFLEHARKPIRQVTSQDVKDYLAARREGGIGPVTQRGELRRLDSFFRALRAAEVIEHDPTEGLIVTKASHKPPILLAEEAVRRLLVASLDRPPRCADLAAPLALRNRACFELLYGVGIRDAEARAVRVLDLRLNEGVLLVRRVKRGEGSFLPLPEASLPHLERYLREGRPALTGKGEDKGFLLVSRSGKPLDKCAIWKLVSSTAKRIGLKAHPHAFRRALATHLVRAGVSVRLVQEILGHRRLTTTATYVSVDLDELRRVVEILEHDEHGDPLRLLTQAV